jgi:hypothetical protein
MEKIKLQIHSPSNIRVTKIKSSLHTKFGFCSGVSHIPLTTNFPLIHISNKENFATGNQIGMDRMRGIRSMNRRDEKRIQNFSRKA